MYTRSIDKEMEKNNNWREKLLNIKYITEYCINNEVKGYNCIMVIKKCNFTKKDITFSNDYFKIADYRISNIIEKGYKNLENAKTSIYNYASRNCVLFVDSQYNIINLLLTVTDRQHLARVLRKVRALKVVGRINRVGSVKT